MSKQIPYLFTSSFSSITESQNLQNNNKSFGRANVRVFTKYANRNGSYITDAVAEQLIYSATTGIVPVVGFFDPQSSDWTSHVGPTLACGYGYVDKFVGWENAVDSDGIEREYAVFSVVLFSDYFKEANQIVGKSQSMELDVNSIDGDWATIDGKELFVYTKAKMLGFCVLGDNTEPCFSASAFFNKKDDEVESQFEKFSKVLMELREQVEGGEIAMEENKIVIPEEQEISEFEEVTQPIEESIVEEMAAEEGAVDATEFEADTVESVEEEVEVVEETEAVFEANVESENAEISEPEEIAEPVVDYESMYNELLNQHNDYVISHNEMVANYNQQIENLNAELATANTRISEYEAQAAQIEEQNKQNLINSYENQIPENEISVIRDAVNDFSYEEIESKLAIAFAHYTMRKKEENVLRAPVNQPEESDFARLMKNYKR